MPYRQRDIIFFRNEPNHLVTFHDELRTHLPAFGRILDLGCGPNRELAPYRTTGRQVWGTDFQTHPELTDAQWFRPMMPDGKIPFPSGSFEVVAASWVLEHVMDPEHFLGEVRRVLRPGGYLVAHTISGVHYVTGLRRLMSVFPHDVVQNLIWNLYKRPAHDTFPTCYRLNSASQLRRACEKTGLAIHRIRRCADQGYFRFCRMLLLLANVCDWTLEHLSPGLGRLYLTVTLRSPSGSGSRRA
jgi:SAM-dependent methyltransferase